MKKTDWYPGSVKPARNGLYQRLFGDGTVYWALFTNGEWRCSHGLSCKDSAEREKRPSPTQHSPEWRGLTKESK